MRILLVLLILIFSAFSVQAQTPSAYSIQITKVGIFEATTTSGVVTTSAGRPTVDVTTYKFVSDTTTIPGRKGVHFGFEYIIRGPQTASPIPLKNVTIFPEQGLRDPLVGKTLYRDDVTGIYTVGRPHLRGYEFDEDWEIVPGVWTFQIFYRDQKLAEQSFTVVNLESMLAPNMLRTLTVGRP